MAGGSSALLAGMRWGCGYISAECTMKFRLRKRGQGACKGDEVRRGSLEKGAGVLLGGCPGAILSVVRCFQNGLSYSYDICVHTRSVVGSRIRPCRLRAWCR